MMACTVAEASQAMAEWIGTSFRLLRVLGP